MVLKIIWSCILTILFLSSAAQSSDSISALNNRAQELFNKGEYKQARTLFLRVLNAHSGKPDMDQARSMSGYAQILSTSDFRTADSLYVRALEIVEQKSEKSTQYAEVLQGLAEVRILQQKYDGVEEQLGRVLEIHKQRSGEKSMAYADALSVLGWYYAQRADFPRSEQVLTRAEAIASRIAPDSYGYAKILHKAFFLHFYKQDKAAADSCCCRAIVVYERTASPTDRRLIEIRGNQAIGYIPERIKEAEQIIVGLLPVIECNYGKEDYTYSALVMTLASIYAYTGQTERALPLFEESMLVIRQLFGEQREVYYNALNNLAIIYLRTERFAEAEPLLLRSLQIRKELTGTENPAYIKALNNLAVMYLNMGGYERAAERFREVAESSSRLLGEASKSHLLALSNLGICYMHSGQREAAIEVADQCEELFVRHQLAENRDLAEIHAVNLLTAMLCDKDDPELGEKIAQSSAMLKALSGESNMTYQNTLNGLANYYLKKQDYAQALYYAESDLAAVGKHRGKETSLYMKALSNKGAACYMLHRWEEAETTLAECLDVARRLAAENLAFMSDREREDYWHSVRKPLDNIAGFARFADQNNYHSPALAALLFDRALLSKSLLLNYSATIRKSVLESGDEELVSIWQQLKKLKSAPSPDAVKIEELDKQLSLRSMPYRNQKNDFSATWQDVRDQLADNEAAIEIATIVSSGVQPYYAGLVIRCGADAPQCVMLCPEQTIATALHNPQQAAAELTSTLFAPLEKHLRGVGRIYLSVSGLVCNVSFAGMKDRRGYLSDTYSLCNLMTTKDIARSKQGWTLSETSAVALFGGADFGLPAAELHDAANTADLLRGQGFDYLPGSKKEVTAIGEMLASKGWGSIVYVDKQATESCFKVLSSASPDVIHISTHGYYFPPTNTGTEADLQFKTSADPLIRCGLLFSGANSAWNGEVTDTASDDGILTGAEIALMNLAQTRLVVLSACNTALGDNDYSEGIYGLQRAFRMAGAETLLVALWPIPDRETIIFMTRFYKELTSGRSIRAAFNNTQRSMRQQYPTNPKAWAGFVLVE